MNRPDPLLKIGSSRRPARFQHWFASEVVALMENMRRILRRPEWLPNLSPAFALVWIEGMVHVTDAPFTLFSLKNVGGPDAWNRSGQIAVGRSHAGHITRHEYPEVFAPQADDRTRLEQGCDLDFMILIRGRVAAILAALPRGRLDSNPPNTLFI